MYPCYWPKRSATPAASLQSTVSPVRSKLRGRAQPRLDTGRSNGESIAGGHASPMWQWHAMSYRVLLPHFVRLGVAPADDGDPETIGDRLSAQAAALRAQIVSRPQSCAWAA